MSNVHRVTASKSKFSYTVTMLMQMASQHGEATARESRQINVFKHLVNVNVYSRTKPVFRLAACVGSIKHDYLLFSALLSSFMKKPG